ncbi:hypothetical protein A9Q86_15425 [Flavobacteriales bacterium 33_180_T64]|nr:hypothetical protein A9Q86_15425 [Flavobacteriales bacterium 33_180_T64]
MKKITFFFLLLTVSFGYSQVVLEDFEGPAPALAFSNGPGSATIVADPEMGGTHGNVLEIITGAASAPWQQAELTLQGDYIDLSGVTKVVTVDVYSDTAFDMLARADGGIGGGPAATDASHTGSGWEVLTFDFTIPRDNLPVPTGIYEKIFFFNLWDSVANGWVCGAGDCSPVSTSYVDNITAVAAPAPETCNDGILNNGETEIDCGGPNCSACPSPPIIAAPTPPNRAPADVISIYSDAYADVTLDTFSAGWCGNPAVSEVMIAGNPTQLYLGLPCQGIDFQNNRIDATGFTNFHFDFFTDETNIIGKVFNFKLVDFAFGGAEASAFEININDGTSPGVITGTWVSVDVTIPGSFAVNDIAQIGITSNLASVWYDNIYFHKNTTLGTNEFTSAQFKVYPNPTLNNWNVESNTTIRSIVLYDVLGKQVSRLTPNASDIEISTANINTGLYFAKIESDNGTKTIKLIKE